MAYVNHKQHLNIIFAHQLHCSRHHSYFRKDFKMILAVHKGKIHPPSVHQITHDYIKANRSSLTKMEKKLNTETSNVVPHVC